MTSSMTRRQVLATLPTASLLAHQAADGLGRETPKDKPILDVHIHLIGVGDNRSGCVLSSKIQEGALFKLLVAKLQLAKRAPTLDEGFVLALAEQLKQSGINKGVILAQDAVYDKQGRPDWKKTHFFVPNDYVFRVTAKYPDRMVPCISINPRRADAVDELNRCIEKGARVLKIHPPIQGVDVSDPSHKAFFRRSAEKKMVVMVHTGHEHSAPVVDIDLARPDKLRLALDEGCTVIACHCGTGRPKDRPDMLPEFLKLLRDYEKQGTLWGDTAVLGGFQRSNDFGRLLADEFAKSRLLHGSDFPFPAVPLEFRETLGVAKATVLQMDSNMIRQDFALKDALGIGRPSAEKAYNLLGSQG